MGTPPVLPFNLKLHVNHLFELILEIIDETPSYHYGFVLFNEHAVACARFLCFERSGDRSRKLYSRVLIADIYIHDPKEQHACSETYNELFIENKRED